MALPVWSWPASGLSARGCSLVPFSGGMAVPDWTALRLWPFDGTVFSAAVPASATAQPGFAAAATDSSGAAWAVAWSGALWEFRPGSASGAAHALTGGEVYVGCAIVNDAPYAVASNGAVRDSSNALIGTFASAASSLAASGGTLFAPMPGASAIGTMTSAGVTGAVALPAALAVPAAVAVMSGAVGAVGWTAAAVLSGAAAAAMNPADNSRVMGVGSGYVLEWSNAARGAYSDAWSQVQALTGTASLVAAAWIPNGTQLLAASVASGAMQVMDYSVGVISLAQTLAVSGACAVAAGDNTHALVVQSGAGQVAAVSAVAGTWASAVAATGLADASTAVAYGASGVAVGYSGGLALFQLEGGGTWSGPSLVPLPSAPTALTADRFGQVYAVSSGYIGVVSGGVVVGSGVLPAGSPASVAVQQGRACVAVPSADAVYVMGLSSPGTWTQQASGAVAGASGLAMSLTTLFAMASASTVTLGFSGTPYELTPVLAGAVGIYSGGAWASAAMGPGYTPSACAFDPSGNLWVATTQNDLWQFSPAMAVLASGTVQQQAGQANSVPLGLSALLHASGSLWAATSVAGMLGKVA